MKEQEEATDRRLRRMKWLASGLLAAAAAVYAVAAALEPRHPWLYYVAAAAEAAMVGAVADWFAVVALFHHPMNLRFIPHTAILPRNRARIAEGLSQFIQQNFLSSAAVVDRIAAFRPAHTLCAWLLREDNAEALAEYAAGLVRYGLAAVDDERVRRFLLRIVSEQARRIDLASAAAASLEVLTEKGRHHALLDEALAALDELLSRDETRLAIADEVGRRSPLLKRLSDALRLRLDERAAMRIVDAAIGKVHEVRADGGHELRAGFDGMVARFIERLRRDPSLRGRIERMRDELLANPALAGYVGGLWSEFRDWLSADLASDGSATRARIAAATRAWAASLSADAEVQGWIDRQILAALPALVEEHRAKFGRFIEDQVMGWQERRLVAELERRIGPDLQYIRINGTVVGGLVGLLIAALTRLLS